MDRLRIEGQHILRGEVPLSGSKNAALPILISALLCKGKTVFHRVPNLSDIETTCQLLKILGCHVEWAHSTQTCHVDATHLNSIEAPYDLVRTMRASILVLAPLLARHGEAKVSLPGGCAIGTRPVDYHIQVLEALGATFDLEGGYVHGKIKGAFRPAEYTFPFPSVGATETALMAAATANGKSLFKNVAREPEIRALGNFLISLGAKIKGLGSPEIQVQGIPMANLNTKPAAHTIIPDRIEAATYWLAGLITKGSVTTEIAAEDVQSVLDALHLAGAKISHLGNGKIEVSYTGKINPVSVRTEPFPGFPTDVQAQWMALMTQANGAATIAETIFENRFMHVPELQRLGAHLKIRGNRVDVSGVTPLQGATVMATDLRASASLVIAALAAKGETNIRRIYHLDRGYEDLCGKLRLLGAHIIREPESSQ